MNPFVFVGLGVIASADYYGKGEVDDVVALMSMLLCAMAWQYNNIIFLPIIFVSLYMMHKMGCAYLDLVVFMVISMCLGLAAFLGLFIALGGVLAMNWRKGLKGQVSAAFLPYLFLGCLAADLIVSSVQTLHLPLG
jgi:hypothetical protein